MLSLYGKFFLYSFIGFGLMGVIGFAFVMPTIIGALWRGILFGLAAGVILAGGSALLQWLSTANIPIEGHVSPEQSQTVVVDLPFEAAFERAVASLQVVNAWEDQKDPASGLVTGWTGRTWKSFGETITIQLEAQGSAQTQITVSSTPNSATQIDYGKGYDNVQRIIAYITQEVDNS